MNVLQSYKTSESKSGVFRTYWIEKKNEMYFFICSESQRWTNGSTVSSSHKAYIEFATEDQAKKEYKKYLSAWENI